MGSRWVPGKAYFWKVAALKEGRIATSGIWSFTAGCSDMHCAQCSEAGTDGTCQACVSPYMLQSGRCAPEGGCLGGTWDILATPQKYGSEKTYPTTGLWSINFEVGQLPEATTGCAKH